MLHNLGILLQSRGSYAEALAHYERSLKIKEELGNRSGIANSLGQKGVLLIQLERYDEALQHLLAALSIFEELQSPNVSIVANFLKQLRSKWGVEPFEAAWQEAKGEPVPDEWKEEEKPEG